MVHKNLTSALASTFKRPDQKLSDFVAEMRALTDADKADLKAEYIKAGDTFAE